MFMLGHPILGDPEYWPRDGPLAAARADAADDDDAPRLRLAAVELDLAHPHTGEHLNVCTAEPQEWGFPTST